MSRFFRRVSKKAVQAPSTLVHVGKAMPRFFKRVSKKEGLAPGTLVHVGRKKVGKVKIDIIDYDEKRFKSKEAKRIEECFPFKKKPTVTWINICGLHDVDIIQKIGREFEIHSLVLDSKHNPEAQNGGFR